MKKHVKMPTTVLLSVSATMLGITLFLAGCINTGEVKTPLAAQGFEPKGIYSADVSKVWKITNDALDANHIPVLSSDQTSGRIQTDTIPGANYVSVLGGTTETRYSYNIRITGEYGGKTSRDYLQAGINAPNRQFCKAVDGCLTRIPG